MFNNAIIYLSLISNLCLTGLTQASMPAVADADADATASSTLDTSPLTERAALFHRHEGILEELPMPLATEAIAPAKTKPKKSVSWNDVKEVRTFTNPLVNVKERKKKEPKKAYTLSLDDEHITDEYLLLDTPLRRKTKTLVTKKRHSLLATKVESEACYYFERATEFLNCKSLLVSSSGIKIMKENQAGNLCMQSAKRWFVLMSIREQDALREIMPATLDPQTQQDSLFIHKFNLTLSQFTLEMYTEASENYMRAISSASGMYLHVMLNTPSLQEFHETSDKLIKLFSTRTQLGYQEDVLRLAQLLDSTIFERMKFLHSEDDHIEHLRDLIQLDKQIYEDEIALWQLRIELIKASKGRKAHRKAKLLHARNMLECTQQELKDISKPKSEWMQHLAKAQVRFADDHKKGCAYCVNMLHSLDRLLGKTPIDK